MSEPLTFSALSAVNVERCRRWHPGFPNDEWTGGDWAAAMCGEAGESANVVKKLRRVETAKRGRPTEAETAPLVAKLALELADTVIYLDLLAAYYGIDLGAAVREKFNIVSAEYGFPEMLP